MQLLDRQEYDKVIIFVRRTSGITHPKLTEHIVDFDHLEEWQELLRGDVLFSCMGTTRKQAGSKQRQWTIDHDYQVECAKAARAHGVSTMVMVSSIGANAKSPFFYMRMKGLAEEDIKALGFPSFIIVRPPSLIRKDTDRLNEKLSVQLLLWLNRWGILRSMAPVKTERVAEVMIEAVNRPPSPTPPPEGMRGVVTITL